MGMASVYIKKITLIDHPNAVVFYMPMVLTISFLYSLYNILENPTFFHLFF